MACQRCPRLRQELQRTRDNVLLIEGLLEDARRRERTQDTLDRLAMLHKHCRTNYDDMANINFALNHCQNIPRCPGEWNHVPNWNRNYELSHGWQISRTPPIRGAIFQRQVASPQFRKKMTEEKTMSGDRACGRGPVARCLYEQLLTNGWYNTFSIVNTFYINEMSLVNKFLVSGTVLKEGRAPSSSFQKNFKFV